MGQLNRQFAVLALIAGGSIAAAVAGPKPDPAPRQEARPIPLEEIGTSSGRLDIDFRSSGWTFKSVDEVTGDPIPEEAKKGIVTVTVSEGVLRSYACENDPALDPNCPTGFAVYDGLLSDEGLEKRETLTVELDSEGAGTAAFDIDGVWLSGLDQDRNGEAGMIEIFGVDPEDRRAFSFSWKDVDPDPISGPGNQYAEYFVGFGETQRITKAVLTATSGAFSVAGFSQQPIVMLRDECEQDQGIGGCFAEIAQNVFLDIVPRTGGAEGEGAPGDRGVSGELIKDGVYIVEDLRGSECGSGVGTLRIDLDDDDTTYELVMQSHQCGYPDLDHPDKNVIYVLDLNGAKLDIEEDTIPVKFGDDAGDPDGYFCNAPDPSRRPAYGWVPHSRQNEGVYEEIPLLGADGMPLLGDEDLPNPVQDVTIGSCGSGRGGFSRFSLIPYHWVNAPGTSYEVTIGERIDRLQVYVEQLFPCVQQGVNQSTLSDDTGHIRKSFDMGRYQRAVDYIAEMRGHVLAPRLNDEISQCFFDLDVDEGGYIKVESGSSIPANAVGDLLVQLDHLRWMIRSTLLGEMPGNIPKLD